MADDTNGPLYLLDRCVSPGNITNRGQHSHMKQSFPPLSVLPLISRLKD